MIRKSFNGSYLRKTATTAAVVLSTGMLAGLSACSIDNMHAPVPNPEAAMWNLRLNHHAIQLSLNAPHNSIQLSTVAYDYEGNVLTDLPAQDAESPVRWISTDTTKVLVDGNGVVSARSVSVGTVYVIALRQIGGVTQGDSALVLVSNAPDPRPIASLSVRPAATDSLKFGVWTGKVLFVTAKDDLDRPLSSIPVYMRSLKMSVVAVAGTAQWGSTGSRSIFGLDPGEVQIISEAWVFGETRADTVTLVVGHPVTISAIRLGATGQDDYIRKVGPGGIVGWENATIRPGTAQPDGVAIDIIFDDPDAALPALIASQNTGGGNVLGIPGAANLGTFARTRYRRFLTPGTYTYTVMPLNRTGAIVVYDK